jgi:hypothetical protein
MTRGSVATALYGIRQRGQLQDTERRLDQGVVPAAVEQMQRMVEAGDKEAVLAVLKGRGVFKSHQAGAARGEGPAVMTNLVVKFEMPPGTAKPVLQGQVVGVPREPER